MKLMTHFCIIAIGFSLILMQKERKSNGAVPFCVPLILRHLFLPRSFLIFEAAVPASFLKKRNAFRNAFLLNAFL